MSRWSTEFGMLLILLGLCALFSVLTYSEQSYLGEAAGQQIADQISREIPGAAAILIAGTDLPDDVVFSDTLRDLLRKRGYRIADVIKGTPADARQSLVRLSREKEPVAAIACTKATAAWLVFADRAVDFPAFAQTRLLTPRTYWWPNFLKPENLLNVTNQIAVIAIVAIGMTLVIIAGGIDLSVGSLIALSAVISTSLIVRHGNAELATTSTMVVCCLAGVLATGLVGMLSGQIITRFGVPPFIVTLSAMMIASGLAYQLTRGESVYELPARFVWLGRGADVLRIPNAVVLMLGLYWAFHLLMSRTILGRQLYAVGGNPEAAFRCGIRVPRVILFAYTTSGLLAGVGGVILASQLKSGSPNYGQMYELYTIAAAVVGGCSLAGGEGRMFGTLIGAFIIAVIQNGMNLLGVESYTQKMMLGGVILVAVLLDTLRSRSARSR